MTSVVPFEQLQQLTGYERPTDVAECLRNQGIPVLRGKKGRPFTTLDALNQAMGISGGARLRPQDEV